MVKPSLVTAEPRFAVKPVDRTAGIAKKILPHMRVRADFDAEHRRIPTHDPRPVASNYEILFRAIGNKINVVHDYEVKVHANHRFAAQSQKVVLKRHELVPIPFERMGRQQVRNDGRIQPDWVISHTVEKMREAEMSQQHRTQLIDVFNTIFRSPPIANDMDQRLRHMSRGRQLKRAGRK